MRHSVQPHRRMLLFVALLVLGAVLFAAQKAYYMGRDAVIFQELSSSPADIAAALIEPGFDVIRVTREGRAVLAGSAAPGAEVVLKSGEQILATVSADKRGDWVLILEQPLPPGPQVLTLTARQGADGPILSKESAIISVPGRIDGEVFVAVSREGKATRVLDQGGSGASPGVALAGVDLAESGNAILSGRADPGQRVRLYLDNRPMGEVAADSEGNWELSLSEKIAPGRHLLRADQLSQEDQVALRAEVVFSRAETGGLTIGERQVIVQQGNALWEIARNVYGEGVAYSVIFTGNREQIRDPDLIYPGQIFQIPDPAMPAPGLPQTPIGSALHP